MICNLKAEKERERHALFKKKKKKAKTSKETKKQIEEDQDTKKMKIYLLNKASVTERTNLVPMTAGQRTTSS
jgi:hypothetical protein